MGPKYEFTDETRNFNGHTLHRIRRLSDGQLGGWIEKEDNLSQDDKCWVDYSAKVYDDAQVCGDATIGGRAQIYGNARVEGYYTQVYDDAQVYDNAWINDEAQVYGHVWVGHNAKIYDKAQVHDTAKVYEYAEIYGNADVCGDTKIYGEVSVYDEAKVYGRAEVYDEAQIYGKAKVHGEALIHNTAKIYGNADVYDVAEVYGDAEFCGNAKIYGNMKVNSGTYIDGDYYSNDSSNDVLKRAVQEFICKVVDTNKLVVRTEYTYIDRFINAPIENDEDVDTLSITCITNMYETLIKLQKVEVDRKTAFKFIVDLANEDDDFRFRSVIKSPEQLNLLVQRTIEALTLYPKFNKYAEALDELTV